MQKVIDACAVACGVAGAVFGIAGLFSVMEVLAAAGLCLAVAGAVPGFVGLVKEEADPYWVGYIDI